MTTVAAYSSARDVYQAQYIQRSNQAEFDKDYSANMASAPLETLIIPTCVQCINPDGGHCVWTPPGTFAVTDENGEPLEGDPRFIHTACAMGWDDAINGVRLSCVKCDWDDWKGGTPGREQA